MTKDLLNPHWTILIKASKFPNLSQAAQNVGLSQSQLSRIVKKLEDQTGCLLLDRRVKRKAFWTTEALALVDSLERGHRMLEHQLNHVLAGRLRREIHLGTLEGLSPIGARIVEFFLRVPEIKIVSLDVYDVAELEDLLLKGFFDGILTMREPGLRKFPLSQLLGYQSLDKYASEPNFRERIAVDKEKKSEMAVHVQSHFEFARLSPSVKKRSLEKRVLSNSLAVRRDWLELRGGHGVIPSGVHSRKERKSDDVEVLFLANESLRAHWELLKGFLAGLTMKP